MREEESSWFTRWEDELPSPEELTPLSQTLIPPDLALAFNISPHAPPHPPLSQGTPHHPDHHHRSNPAPSSSEFDSPEPGGDEQPRTLKRPRLVWTPQLHKRFVDAVAHLGIKNAVPKIIMQLMSVDGLTRENVASHLQKYRLYLKRMQGISGAGGGSGSGTSSDPATDHLFASGPVPAHFLHPAAFIPVVANHHHHGHGVVARPLHHPYGHFGNSPPNGGEFEHDDSPFFMRQQRVGVLPGNGGSGGGGGYGGEETNSSRNEPKVLTLFPTGDD